MLCLSRLFLFFIIGFSAVVASATEAALPQHRTTTPGFVYTRARGKCTPQLVDITFITISISIFYACSCTLLFLSVADIGAAE